MSPGAYLAGRLGRRITHKRRAAELLPVCRPSFRLSGQAEDCARRLSRRPPLSSVRMPIRRSQFFFGEHHRRELRIADVDFQLQLAAWSHARPNRYQVSPSLELKMGNVEAFACSRNGADRLRGYRL